MSSLAQIERPPLPNPSDALQTNLMHFNAQRFRPALPRQDWQERLQNDSLMLQLEGRYIEQERRAVAARAATAPKTAEGFVRWFEDLERTGPGQHDPLFPWLAKCASLQDMRWFLEQEVAGEAGFDDLVALTQVKLPNRPKLEMARNYWDEMGQGQSNGMHGPMLSRLAQELELRCGIEHVVVESLALANMMTGLAANRRYAYHSVGALGVIELTAPGRAAQVNAGLKRLGISGAARQYFALHATLDIRHFEAWKREVIYPLVASEPEVASAIAEGALLQLRAGQRCFERYRQMLSLSESAA
jgi:Iron-containing redox enzyme